MTTAMRALLDASLAPWRRSSAPEDAAAFDARAQAAFTDWTPPTATSERSFHRALLRAVDDVIGRGAEARPSRQVCETPIVCRGWLAWRVHVLVRAAGGALNARSRTGSGPKGCLFSVLKTYRRQRERSNFGGF
jgi:hypothetical protein